MLKKLKSKLAIGATAFCFVASSAMAQGFNPETEATTAATTLGTVFGIVFAAAIGIAVGWKVISQIKRA